MTRKPLNRVLHQFLTSSFIENIVPTQKLNKKAKNIIQDKKYFLKKNAKAAQKNIIRQSFLTLFLQQDKKNLVKNFDLDVQWLQDGSQQLLQQTFFPLIRTFSASVQELNPSSAATGSNHPWRGHSTSFNGKRDSLPVIPSQRFPTAYFRRGGGYNGKKLYTFFRKQNKKLSFLFSFAQLKLELLKKQSNFINPLFSDYKIRFLERKKLSFLYGNLSKSELQEIREKASRAHSRTAEKFLILLESRLDVVLHRISFCETIYAARQLITRGQVTVNGVVTRQPGNLLKAGDTLSIVDENRDKIKAQIAERLSNALPLNHSVPCGKPRSGSTQSKQKTKNPFISLAGETTSNHPGQGLYDTKRLNASGFWGKLNAAFKKKMTRLGPRSGFAPRGVISGKALALQPQGGSKTFRGRTSRRKELLLRKKELLLVKAFTTVRRGFDHRSKPSSGLQFRGLFNTLRLNRLLAQGRSRKLVKNSLRISPMKPLHLEVSYVLLTAVFLYPPQKLAFSGSLDLDLVLRELQS